jgi:hypothetical protein
VFCFANPSPFNCFPRLFLLISGALTIEALSTCLPQLRLALPLRFRAPTPLSSWAERPTPRTPVSRPMCAVRACCAWPLLATVGGSGGCRMRIKED